jgi:gamma-glutamyl:cysteine ligase YbdK (ATP-grasp superfamily)
MRPVPVIARETANLARPYARELGSDAALEEIERILIEGNGALRQRRSYARGHLRGVLADLAQQTASRAPAIV